MILTQGKLKSDTYVECVCDECGCKFTRRYSGLKAGKRRRKDDRDLCRPCICKQSLDRKPQCQKDYWNKEKCTKHGETIHKQYESGVRVAKKYYKEANPMYGKKHTQETRNKMKEKRKYRVGELAPDWKGGKSKTLNNRLKTYLHKVVNWYYKVHKKYGWHCAICGTGKGKLDAHHIKPFRKIVNELLKGKQFINDDEKYEYLIQQTELIDPDINNGICLCRECHKKVHFNWGSHNPEVDEEIYEKIRKIRLLGE